jgi:hypothetical protein
LKLESIPGVETITSKNKSKLLKILT